MSSIAAPFGLNPIGRHDTGSLEVMRQYPIKSGESTAITKGDIVKLVNASNATTIARQADDGTSALSIAGIFMGCRFTDPNTKQLTFSQVFPAGTVASDAMAFVVDDPNVLFTIQADGSFANERDIYGKNCTLITTAGNTTFGISRTALDASEIATTSTDPIKIIDYLGGDLGDEKGSNFPILVCKFNYHQLTAAAGAS